MLSNNDKLIITLKNEEISIFDNFNNYLFLNKITEENIND